MYTIPESVILNNKNIKIETSNGFENFYGINKIKKYFYIHIIFDNGKELKCSPKHPLFNKKNNIVKAFEVSLGDEIKSKFGFTKVIYHEIVNEPIELYDIVNSGKNNSYYSNDILSHNCDFIGSTNTLISSDKLKQLAHINPIYKEEGLNVYQHPQKDHLYNMCVDVSRGQGLDNSAFIVVDITEFPYRVIAKYSNSNISPLLFPTIINHVGIRYNEASILVETNDVGHQVSDTLQYDLEYPNLLTTVLKSKRPQATSGFSKNIIFGLKTTSATKNIGCGTLKSLIEENKLIIEDFDIIRELSSFCATTNTFEGDNCTDDLVMCLVLFGWLVNQRYFKEFINSDVGKKIYEEHIKHIEEELIPFGFFSDGIDDRKFIDSDGQIWEIAEEQLTPFQVG